MKTLITLSICFLSCFSSTGQTSDKLTTIDFVKVLNNNYDEAHYYYKHNWKILRKMAVKRGYIDSFEILEVPKNKNQEFDLMLITTYGNQKQYKLREEHFQELIKIKGGLNLLNNKKPSDFRKTLFSKEKLRHWR